MSILTNKLNSVAFPFNGIVLLNNFVQANAQIKAIEFYTNNLDKSVFDINVI